MNQKLVNSTTKTNEVQLIKPFAAARTHPIAPCAASVVRAHTTLCVVMRAVVGLNPTTPAAAHITINLSRAFNHRSQSHAPQNAAGIRMDPPTSVPMPRMEPRAPMIAPSPANKPACNAASSGARQLKVLVQ
jgi:hypothetical protein